MKYVLKTKDGNVDFLMKTGEDFVKSSMSVEDAQKLLNESEVTKSDVLGYPISIEDNYFFAGRFEEDKKPKKKR